MYRKEFEMWKKIEWRYTKVKFIEFNIFLMRYVGEDDKSDGEVVFVECMIENFIKLKIDINIRLKVCLSKDEGKER